MTQDQLKQLVARAALEWVPPGAVIGVGSGSTVNHFIDALAQIQQSIQGAVSSSQATTDRLLARGIRVFDADQVLQLQVYIDGADEIDPHGCMVKGGGAALTREKIVADLAQQFICIVDASKQVPVLGRFPLPVEVIPMAAAQLVRRFQATFGGHATLRNGVVTDNGNHLLDVRGLTINDPGAMETEINQWPGVVTVGLFARRHADLCLVGTPAGVQTLKFD
jgi:ribose 5-phosphate isomerase A